MDNLTWLTQWFGERCDGEWESDYGVTVESVNNPGWMVRVDLDGTGLNPATFKPLAIQRTETNWVECKVEEGAWLGGGGVGNLDEVIGIFRAWVDRNPRKQDEERPRGSRAPHRVSTGGKNRPPQAGRPGSPNPFGKRR